MTHATLGELLKEARRAAGLSQEALASRAGVSARAISDLERNVNHTPRPTTVRLLVSALGLSDREREHFEGVARAQVSSSMTHEPLRSEVGGTPIQRPRGVSPPPLIGRVSERLLLEQHLAGDGPPVLMLAGEPGIGKTRLLQEAVKLAASRGLTVLSGAVPIAGEFESLDPIADALRHHIRGRSPVLLRQDLQGCGWLVRLLPELADGPLEPATPGSVSTTQEPAVIASAVVRFLANTAAPGGTVLVLDDLQYGDQAALGLLARVVRSMRDEPLRVVAAYRDGHVTGGDRLGSLLGMLAQEGLARRHALSPLSPTDSVELLRANNGSAIAAAAWSARALHESGGVPFYLAAWAHSVTNGSPSDPVPWPISQSVRHRIVAGPPAVRPVLESLAVAGGRATYAVLGRLADQPDGGVLEALEWALRERLTNEDGDAYTFAYEVIRSAVEADLTRVRRLALRRRLAALIAGDVQKLKPQSHSRKGNNDRDYHLSVLMQASKSVASREGEAR